MSFKTFLLVSIPLLINFLLTSTVQTCYNKTVAGSFNDTALKTSLSEEKFILVNGIQQWVTVKGENFQPVILFLHGGPGSPISPYSDNLYKDWKDFIIVQWDQRGAGKTFGLSAPAELTPAGTVHKRYGNS